MLEFPADDAAGGDHEDALFEMSFHIPKENDRFGTGDESTSAAEVTRTHKCNVPIFIRQDNGTQSHPLPVCYQDHCVATLRAYAVKAGMGLMMKHPPLSQDVSTLRCHHTVVQTCTGCNIWSCWQLPRGGDVCVVVVLL